MTDPESRQMMLSLLTSIDGSLKKLVAIAEKRKVGDNAGPTVANDAELDSQYGDEKIRFDPREWKGPSMKGATMSACPPEYLEMLATSYDYFARKNADSGDAKKAGYERKSAARARGWARRKLDGWKAPQTSQADDDDFGQDADFA